VYVVRVAVEELAQREVVAGSQPLPKLRIGSRGHDRLRIVSQDDLHIG
jgi:hypothetical protein